MIHCSTHQPKRNFNPSEMIKEHIYRAFFPDWQSRSARVWSTRARSSWNPQINQKCKTKIAAEDGEPLRFHLSSDSDTTLKVINFFITFLIFESRHWSSNYPRKIDCCSVSSWWTWNWNKKSCNERPQKSKSMWVWQHQQGPLSCMNCTGKHKPRSRKFDCTP